MRLSDPDNHFSNPRMSTETFDTPLEKATKKNMAEYTTSLVDEFIPQRSVHIFLVGLFQ